MADLHLINTGLFSSPVEIFRDLRTLFLLKTGGRSVLLTHFMITLKRLFFAAMAGIFVGILAGAFMGLSKWVYRFLDPILSLIMPIPGIAMAPIFIVWMGFGDQTIIAVGAIATFFPVAYNTSTGVRSVDKQLVRAARIMGAKKIRILVQVYLPWAAVYLGNGIKLGLARGWRTVIAVEFIAAANWGLGYMIWDGAEYLRAGIVYGGIILLAITFTLIEKGLIGGLERVTIEKWGMVGY